MVVVVAAVVGGVSDVLLTFFTSECYQLWNSRLKRYTLSLYVYTAVREAYTLGHPNFSDWKKLSAIRGGVHAKGSSLPRRTGISNYFQAPAIFIHACFLISTFCTFVSLLFSAS